MRLCKVIGRQSNDSARFANDEDYINLCDIIGRVYGVLPSDVRKMNWEDLLFCVRCVKARSVRMQRLMKNNKKAGTMPTISLMDVSDLI